MCSKSDAPKVFISPIFSVSSTCCSKAHPNNISLYFPQLSSFTSLSITICSVFSVQSTFGLYHTHFTRATPIKPDPDKRVVMTNKSHDNPFYIIIAPLHRSWNGGILDSSWCVSVRPSARSSARPSVCRQGFPNFLKYMYIYYSIHFIHGIYHYGVILLAPIHFRVPNVLDHSGYGLSQWKTTLHCSGVFHWLSTYPEWSFCAAEATM